MRYSRELIVIVIIGVVVIAVLFALERIKAGQAAVPRDIVTTFKSDPRTSRAFTWYTDKPQKNALVQLIKGGSPTGFNGNDVITVTGIAASIEIGGNRVRGVNKAEAVDLEPGTVYAYRLGSGDEDGWSDPSQFATEAVNVSAFTFIDVADSQGASTTDFELWGQTLVQAFRKFPNASFIVHNGDLTEDPENEQGWTDFMSQAQPWTSGIPLMPVTGNHDEVDKKADVFVSHFNLPDNGAEKSIPGTTNAFDYGQARIIMLNTESNKKEQTKWLRKQLEDTDKPWKIIALHRGPYGGNSNDKIGDWVELFDEFKVDLVLQGHNHEYARSYPLRSGKVIGDGETPVQNREGTVYIVPNAAGGKFNEKKEDQLYHKVHFQNGKQMFAGISIDGDKLVYEAYDVEGSLLDTFEITH
ncbi:purple acid phosphatase family protein [Paenibacillus nasutitermitis]|uniref:Metallophosphoesterase n=1 Tax=Paenibacillus nasutitermitis TaxID=1652958 RepID=A0A917DXX1_9BACL|nr:metallophosphoesterase family protein [Paenibacillus nasutitermitis]GGD77191.1 hypothetical protein GCM10010911_39020 [Paenibacillus nasutitermitis]